ncbi:MAG: hypothetical protein ACR2KQ_05990 [Actinomycetota bacterium]
MDQGWSLRPIEDHELQQVPRPIRALATGSPPVIVALLDQATHVQPMLDVLAVDAVATAEAKSPPANRSTRLLSPEGGASRVLLEISTMAIG